MTTPVYSSGFISNFTSTPSIPNGFLDILSASNNSTSQYNNNGTLGTMPCTYFYLGNLLIQYVNLQLPAPQLKVSTNLTITFPIPYSSNPTVFLAPLGNYTYVQLVEQTSSYFIVTQDFNNQEGLYPNWFAIGPAVPPQNLNYSGFLTNFSNSFSNIPVGIFDILSSLVETNSPYTINNTEKGSFPARYFYLGNLLLQYINVGETTPIQIQQNDTITITFPVPYPNIPNVLITPWNSKAPIGITSISSQTFSVVCGGANNNYPNWIAIGTVPILSYTATGSYNVTSNSSYNTIIYFTGNGTITFNQNAMINYIMVGAGGNGGGGTAPNNSGAGGGGGGEVISSSYFFTGEQSYSINVANSSSSNTNITSSQKVILSCNNGSSGSNVPGGTGGSSGNNNPGGTGAAPITTNTFFGGGGGGNGGIGGSTTGGPNGGSGGPGFTSPIDGTIYGVGGNGGSSTNSSQASSGAPNTGNGGVGSNSNGIGGSGGSGVVVLYFNI